MTGYIVERIDKIKHPIAIEARQLNSGKARNDCKKIMLRGTQQIEWALNFGLKVNYLIVVDKTDIAPLEKYKLKVYQTTEGILKKITDTNYLVPLIAVAERKCFSPQKTFFSIVMNDIVDYGNIGTIVRTAYAYGVKDYLVTSEDFDLYNTKTIDASRGTVLNINVKRFNTVKDTISYLRKKGYQIITTSPRGNTLQSLINLQNKPIVLVLGNERAGVSDEFLQDSDFVVQIPMYTEIESLNVGVAAGISIYEIKLKEVILMLKRYIQLTLGRNLNVSAQLLKEVFNSQLKSVVNYTADQIVFLMVLRCEEVIEINTFEKQFGYFGEEAESFLQILADDQLIHRDGSKLTITKIGEEVIGKTWPLYNKTENMVLNGFSDEEREILNHFMQRVQENCKKLMETRE